MTSPADTPDGEMLWPHSGVTAPAQLALRGYQEIPVACGLAFAASVVHPRRGVIGAVGNDGHDATTFYPAPGSAFQLSEWEHFVDASHRDGHRLRSDELLDYLIVEHRTARAVTRARRAGHTLVRSITDEPAGPPTISLPIPYTRLALDRHRRAHLAGELAKLPDVPDSSRWQIHLGDRWDNLHQRLRLIPTSEQAARGARARHALDHEHTPTGNVGEGWTLTRPFAFGQDTAWDLIEHPHPLNIQHLTWCHCLVPTPTMRFERWTADHGLTGSGELHVCGGLLRMD